MLFSQFHLTQRISLSVLFAAFLVMIPVSWLAHAALFDLRMREMRDRIPLLVERTSDYIAQHEAVVMTTAEIAAKSLEEQFTQDSIPSHDALWATLEHSFIDSRLLRGMVLVLTPCHDILWETPTVLAIRRSGDNNQHTQLERLDLTGEFDWRAAPWFTASQWSGCGVWDVTSIAWSGGDTATFYVPLYTSDTHEFVGVLGCDLSLDWLSQFIQTLNVHPPDTPSDQQGSRFLVNREGDILSHPNRDLLHKNMTDANVVGAEVAAIAEQVLSGKEFFQVAANSFFGDSEGYVVPIQISDPFRVRQSHWILVLFFPKTAIESLSHSLWRWQIAIGAMALLVLCGIMFWVSRSVVQPIRALEKTAERLAEGDLDVPIPTRKGDDEVSRLSRAFVRMRDDLKQQMHDLAATTQVKERIESDLRIARDIQRRLVPTAIPDSSHRASFDLNGMMIPARAVGGDFYDFFMVGDNKLCLVLADVSGKGIPGSLTMAQTSAFFRSSLLSHHSLEETMQRVNRDLCRQNESNVFVSLIGVVVDLSNGATTLCSAGHNPPFLLRAGLASESAAPLATFLDIEGGLLLGLDCDQTYTATQLTLHAGDMLYLYTDGVTEAMNARDELFGVERLSELLFHAVPQTCSDVNAMILNALRQFAQDTPQSDDITMVTFKRVEA
ncbi:MAG: SpoIIE family protein phosphatase [Thermoguttaceae bacterium]